MTFLTFLNENYSPAKKKKIISLLCNTGLYDKIEKFVNDYYGFMKNSSEDKKPVRFKIFVVGYLIISGKGISGVQSAGLIKSAADAIIDLGKKLILFTCNHTATRNGKYNSEMGEMLKTVAIEAAIEQALTRGLLIVGKKEKESSVGLDEPVRALQNYLHWNTFENDDEEKLSKRSFARD